MENYRRTISYDSDLQVLLDLAPFDEYSFLITYFIGISYQFVDFMNATVQYSRYIFNYDKDYGKRSTSWGRTIANQRGNISVGLSYIF